MTPREPEHAAVRKAERLARARRGPPVWAALVRAAGLGWILVLPLALGAAAGRLTARWLGRPSLALVGLGVGLAVGAYGLFREVKLGLERDQQDQRDDQRDEKRREP